jgi:hypothetical protein
MGQVCALYLLEKVFVYFLDMERVLDPAAHIMSDHQTPKFITIDQYDPLAQMFGGLLCRGRKGRGCHEKTARINLTRP